MVTDTKTGWRLNTSGTWHYYGPEYKGYGSVCGSDIGCHWREPWIPEVGRAPHARDCKRCRKTVDADPGKR